jgi:cell division septation protein DedD
MKKTSLMFIPLMLLLLLSACSQKKPAHHPRNPNYKITKPTVKYKPNKKNLAKMVKKLQGSPYVWAEEGPYNFDCSGFTYYLYGSMGINIPRVARHQARVGKRITANALQYGDLIFFATSKRSRRKITHVGMYLGDGWFTHASTVKHEVIYSNLFTSTYYKKRLRICRRYLPESSVPIRVAPTTQEPWKTVSTQTPTPSIPQKKSPIEERKPMATSMKKAIVIKAPLKEIEQVSSKGNYYVQVGSFIGNPERSLINDISYHGFKHKIIQFPRAGKQVSKLLIGPYITRGKASHALIQVRANIQKDAFIAEIR